MIEEFDLAIVGSGFSGSLLSMIAKRLGRSVVLLEKTRHPRFAIGESSTPLANLLLDELAVKYDLPRIRPLSKWGTWQRTYPDVGCGLKRGFTFYHHDLKNETGALRENFDNELLVAASPHNGIADTHWYRPDFDHFLVREAETFGVDYRDETTLHSVEENADGLVLGGSRHGKRLSLGCRFLIDATGPRGFLFNQFKLPEASIDGFPKTEALYSHFKNVKRIDELSGIGIDGEAPYPVDDAAVHHVFDGGWIWVLRFNNGITSAGVAMRKDVADELIAHDGSSAWKRLLDRLPRVAKQFVNAEPVIDFVHARNLSFLCGQISGRRWALLPSAAGFIDPLLSTGFPLTLLGVGRIAAIIEKYWDGIEFSAALGDYATETRDDIVAAADLVGALYATMDDFPLFRAVSKLYFAAVVFSESAKRLKKPWLADSFLLRKNPRFGPAVRSICEAVKRHPGREERERLICQIESIIEPFDVAGLTDPLRTNRYPVLANDLIENCHKLDAEPDEVGDMLKRSGFWQQ